MIRTTAAEDALVSLPDVFLEPCGTVNPPYKGSGYKDSYLIRVRIRIISGVLGLPYENNRPIKI